MRIEYWTKKQASKQWAMLSLLGTHVELIYVCIRYIHMQCATFDPHCNRARGCSRFAANARAYVGYTNSWSTWHVRMLLTLLHTSLRVCRGARRWPPTVRCWRCVRWVVVVTSFRGYIMALTRYNDDVRYSVSMRRPTVYVTCLWHHPTAM